MPKRKNTFSIVSIYSYSVIIIITLNYMGQRGTNTICKGDTRVGLIIRYQRLKSIKYANPIS